ncbi:unnamed protein product [Tilletia controversa]|uniref:Uncharacterized protein n=2 Tax=Tilletia TaxID=13289 RepID=A0A9N8LKP5_9BASI|nr:hypothetical protein CF335_g2689 [Tilletia laevis]CAD6884015.1 unnamed protein product [Tilletia caries]CAD6926182.1 unnamed protein product [Tilletia controversa]CAD6924195.1 unnamed protein product [Tilletia laevis]CAD6930454.1 unnamed protein product [Tilletia caries]
MDSSSTSPSVTGANPYQKHVQAFVMEGTMPVKTLCGSPGYINILNALNALRARPRTRTRHLPPRSRLLQTRLPPQAQPSASLLKPDSAQAFFVADYSKDESTPLSALGPGAPIE